MRLAAFATAFSLLLATGLTACADDPIQPGSVTAKWTLFPQDCQALRLAQVRARAYRADGTVENENTVPCVTDGTVTVDLLPPGTYKVVVDGLSDEPTPRATHAATEPTVKVVEGADTATKELSLTQKPGSVHVRWVFSDALPCVDHSVTQIEVKLLDSGINQIGEPQTVDCDGSFIDPEDQKQTSGAFFEEVLIQDQTKFSVVVNGFETVGGTASWRGSTIDQTLGAGERKLITVTLDPVATP